MKTKPVTPADPRDGLLPCPFCGSDAEVDSYDAHAGTFVQCCNCGARVNGGESEWNARIAHARPEAVDEKAALEVLIDALSEEHGGEHHEDGCDVCRAIATLTPQPSIPAPAQQEVDQAVAADNYRWLRCGGWEVLQDPKYWRPEYGFDGAIAAARADVATNAALAHPPHAEQAQLAIAATQEPSHG